MALENQTDAEIEMKVGALEVMINRAANRDPKSLPALNKIYQSLIDEQVRRDMLKQKETK